MKAAAAAAAFALPLVLLPLACTPSADRLPDGTLVDRRCRAIEPNGPDLTGTAMKRVPAPGCKTIENIQLGAVSLAAGATLPGGQVVRDLTLDGGALRAGDRPAEELIGALLSGQSETGQPVRLRIEQRTTAPAPSLQSPPPAEFAAALAQPVPLYVVSYQWADQPDGAWTPLCADGGGAAAVPGEWDLRAGVAGGGHKRASSPSSVTLACPGSALAKCVTLFGYRPWASAAMDTLHQSCVRAVRADYCGDGQSMTRPNEQVNFYDSLGLQRDGADWRLEAEWTPDGARCIGETRLEVAPADDRTRRAEVKVRDYLKRACPRIPATCPPGGTATTLYTESAPK